MAGRPWPALSRVARGWCSIAPEAKVPRTLLLAALGLLLLGGCVPTSALKMHDLYVYGVENERFTYFYGQPGQILYEGSSLSLTEATARSAATDLFAVPGALQAGGRPYLRAGLQPLATEPVRVIRIPFTTDVEVALGADVEEVVYFDGQSFLRLMLEGQAGTVQRVVPRPRLNLLRGLGQLSAPEADALAAALRAYGQPFALALLPNDGLPPHPVDGLAEHRRTGVYVQLGIGTTSAPVSSLPEELVWEVVASGNQAVGFQSASFQLLTSQDQLISLWQRAYGSQLNVPPLPALDFRRETVVALFLGSRPTGGYGIDVQDARDEDGDLYLDLSLSEPAAGAITTQAITSPWIIVSVQRGGYVAAWLRLAGTGNLLGVARADR